MKKRTRARELVLQALYQLDLQGDDFIPEIGNFVNDEEEDAGTEGERSDHAGFGVESRGIPRYPGLRKRRSGRQGCDRDPIPWS